MAKQNFDVVANIVIARALPIRTGVQVVVSQRSRCEGSKLPRGESSQMEQFAARKLPFALSAIKCRWTASSSMGIEAESRPPRGHHAATPVTPFHNGAITTFSFACACLSAASACSGRGARAKTNPR